MLNDITCIYQAFLRVSLSIFTSPVLCTLEIESKEVKNEEVGTNWAPSLKGWMKSLNRG